MLLDANVLIYAVDRSSAHHARSAEFLTAVLDGDRRVAIPWQTIGAFLRIVTHPRLAARPLAADVAWSFVHDWLDRPVTWIPPESERTASILGRLVLDLGLTANLIPDAQLAALAIEHGLSVVSADTDFARFSDVPWTNPLR